MPVFEALVHDSSALALSIIYVYVVLQLDMFFFFVSEKVFGSRMSYLIYVYFFFRRQTRYLPFMLVLLRMQVLSFVLYYCNICMYRVLMLRAVRNMALHL